MKKYTLSAAFNQVTAAVAAAATALAIAATGLGSSTAWAGDGDPTTSNIFDDGVTIPYEGFLMLDSDPMVGQRELRFNLYDGPGVDAGIAYAETNNVTLYNGQFSVAIGTGIQLGTTPLEDAVLDGEKLYLSIDIRDANGDWVSLAGRQAIEAVPYSAWTANAASMSVASLTATGNVQGQTVNALGTVSGPTGSFTNVSANSVNAAAFRGGAGASINVGGYNHSLGPVTFQGGVSQDMRVVTQEGRLVLGSASRNTPQEVILDNDSQVNGTLTVTGDIVATGNTMTCSDTPASSGLGWVECPEGQVLKGIRFVPSGAIFQIRLRCCSL